MQKQALVVDDSRVARLTLSKLLAPYDLDIVQISSGEEALSYLHANSVRPDIIFMDVVMGGLDGLETTKKIKENENFNTIPVVMCTGNDTQSDQNNALAAGAIAALSKPPKQNSLAEIMAQLEGDAEVLDEQIAESVMQQPSVNPEINIAMPALNDNLITQLEQQWLPKIRTSIEERVGDITRRVATETAKGVLFNQALSSPQMADNSDLSDQIAEIIERDFLPKIQQTTRAVAESLSRQIVLESMETAIASHMTGLLPSLKEQLKQQTKQGTIEVAQQAAQKMIDDSAESAVQFAIDDLDLPAKALLTLERQGEAWLTKQEQHISLIASQQLEQNIAPLIAQYLDVNLAEKVVAHLAEIEAQKPKEENKELSGLIFQFEELTKKVSFLKEVVIVLSVVVVAVVGVALFLNAGIL